MPVLRNAGVAPADWRNGIYYAYYGENMHHVARHDGVRNDRYKLLFLPNSNEWQLFDLQNDPQELKSIHDDPASADVLAEMKTFYHQLRAQYEVP